MKIIEFIIHTGILFNTKHFLGELKNINKLEKKKFNMYFFLFSIALYFHSLN